MASAKNSHDAGPLGGPPAMEYQLPIGDWHVPHFQFRISSFQFRISSFDGQGRWAEEKKFTSKPDKLLKTKDRSTN
jgi:hypothetical protein